VRYLARCDRTAAQVERFLRQKGASPASARRTVARLSALRYLDDCGYARRWIEGCLARRPMGRERLKAELLRRGVAEPLADRTVREVLHEIDEETLARQALRLRQRGGRRLTPVQAARLLRQRGFEEDMVEQIIEERRGTEGAEP
jgi:regulatory protein